MQQENIFSNNFNKKTVISVSAINEYISKIINFNEDLINICIKGEISNYKNHPNGIIYLTLKDEKSSIKCMIFKNVHFNNKKFQNLKNGYIIEAIGSVKVYVKGGAYSFIIFDINISNDIGKIYLEYEKLKQHYLYKGYFDSSIKKAIIKYPKNIGVITADSGAAVEDIKKTINRRFPSCNIYVFPCIVQGEKAPLSIAKQITNANNFKINLDTLIVARGGGSFEDLSCYSSKEVIESIFKSNIPIISGVGHQTDNQLSDYVADLAAATPTAAAEKATPSNIEIKRFLFNSLKELEKIMKNKHNNLKNQLIDLKNNYHLKNFKWFYKQKEEKLNNLISNFIVLMLQKINKIQNFLKQDKIFLKNFILRIIKDKENVFNTINTIFKEKHFINNGKNIYYDKKVILNNYEKNIKILINKILESNNNNLLNLKNSLKHLNPLEILSKGYAVIKHNNKYLKSSKNVFKKDKLDIIMYDGRIKTKVIG